MTAIAFRIYGMDWRALLRLRPDTNLLMVVAVGGLALESWSVGRARRAIVALMALTPETARVIHADGTGMSLLLVFNALRLLRT